MTDQSDSRVPGNSAFRVLAAIADLGEATAAAIAEKAGLGYSTVTPKLRAWENTGQAEKYYNADLSQTLWRLTDAGRASTATPGEGGSTVTAAPAAAAGPEPAADDAAPAATGPVHHGDETPAAGEPDGTTAPVDASPAATTDPPDASPPPIPAGQTEPAASVEPGVGVPPKRKRPKGALEASALAILKAHPATEYKVVEMKTAIDAADADTGYPRASEGAVSNALHKLAREAKAVLLEDRKAATFQLAATTD